MKRLQSERAGKQWVYMDVCVAKSGGEVNIVCFKAQAVVKMPQLDGIDLEIVYDSDDVVWYTLLGPAYD